MLFIFRKSVIGCVMTLILAVIPTTLQYKICALSIHADDCQQLERGGNIHCSIVKNEAACLLQIESGNIDFGSVSAESAFLANTLTSNINVAGQFTAEEGDEFDYETVVVTNAKVKDFSELKGFKFCHPGLNTTDIPPLLLKEFNLKMIKENYINVCEKNLQTINENYYNTLNNFFGPSCVYGRWVQDDSFDSVLKNKYSRLMELCNSTAYQNSKDTHLEKALNCVLSETSEALAVTTLQTVKTHVNLTANQNIFFLHKNGSTGSDQAVWSQQPFGLIVMHRDNINLPKELRIWFTDITVPVNQNTAELIELNETELKYLRKILLPHSTHQIRVVDDESASLLNYTKKFRDSPTQDEARLCKDWMRWCTISDEEQQKCEWLSRASINYGIQPVVKCVQKSSKVDCINAIKTEDADIVMLDADYGYTALRNNLSAIAFPETMKNQEINTLLVVRSTSISRLQNLKHKKACFSQFGDIAWVSFIDIATGIVLPTDSCDYGKLISDFVGDSCMPGARETKRTISNTVNADKVCHLCQDRDGTPTCLADENNKYYGNEGALACLKTAGDFAVITKTVNITQLPENVAVMCKNGTLSQSKGLDVDEDCYLSVVTTSEISTRRGDPKNEDLKLALLEFDFWFAAETRTPFRLFDSFNDTLDLLFKDSTPGLDLPSSNKKAIQNYVGVFKRVNECAGAKITDEASKTVVTTMLILLMWAFTNYL